jgi:molybdopterin converting factor small subunit
MGMVTVRYWAAAKQAAGLAEEKLSAGTLAEALAAATAGRGSPAAVAAFAAVLARSSFLVDGIAVGSRAAESVQLADAAIIEVLPPFAGG